MRTKKVGMTGKYGARYGRKVKKKILSVETAKNRESACPACLDKGIKREASGVWVCKKCGLKVAGKAYRLK
jgi:large subunit ribosomal protein L37Ae